MRHSSLGPGMRPTSGPSDTLGDTLLHKDGSVQLTAAAREFVARRDALVLAGSTSALAKVAAFLLATSYLNSREGRDGAIIPESLTCGVVAGYLQIDIDALAEQLVELQRRGLIELVGRGLHLVDLTRLEAVVAETNPHRYRP